MSSKAPPGPLSALDPLLFRRACAQFATGITVVTVLGSHGDPHGLTVNSFSSVSLEPPLVLVSIDLRNAILGHFLSCNSFAINILAHDQEHLSRRFSTTAERKFEGVDWVPGDMGSPLLPGTLAQLECITAQTFEAGDHTVLIGEVRRASWREGRPLLYFNSAYANL